MEEVFAGFVCGFVMALVTTPVLAFYLMRLRARSEVFARLAPPETSIAPLVVVIQGGLFFLWTGLGIILGLVLIAMRHAGPAAGSPNGAFTLLVAGLTLAVVAPVAIVSRSLRQPSVAAALLMLGVFGWLMPYMATWSNFSSS